MGIKKYSKKDTTSFITGYNSIVKLITTKRKIVEKVQIRTGSEKTHETSRQLIYLCKVNKIDYEFASSSITLKSGKESTLHLAHFKKFQTSISNDEPHVLIISPENHSELGEIIRNMSAMGFVNLAIINPAIDIFSPSVLRQTNGEIFNIRFQYFSSIGEYFNQNKNKEFITIDNIDTVLPLKTIRDIELNKNSCITLLNNNSSDSTKYLVGKRMGLFKFDENVSTASLARSTQLSLLLYILRSKS